MKKLIDYALHQPVFIILGTLIFVMAGVIAYYLYGLQAYSSLVWHHFAQF